MTLDARIRRELAAGRGKKSIARDAGVSEWRVRCIARAMVTEVVLGRGEDEIRLSPVKAARMPQDRAIVLSDIHIPHHDRRALAVAVAYLRDAKPDMLVLNGDIVDEAPTGAYPKDPKELITLEDEFAETRAFLALLRKTLPKCEIVYTKGNHEDRLERYLVRQAPELASMGRLSLCALLDLERHRIRWVESSDHVAFGPFEISHGEVVRKGGGNSIRGHMQKRGGSMVMGHIHRLATVMVTDRFGTHYGVENGCLCGLQPSYIKHPDWQQGFTQIDLAAGVVSVRQHHIQGGKLLVDGNLYTA